MDTLRIGLILLCACFPALAEPQASRPAAGEGMLAAELSNGGRVLLVQSRPKEWGLRIEMPGMASVRLEQPVRLKAYQSESRIADVAAGYNEVKKTANGFTGQGQLTPAAGVVVRFDDTWTISGAAASVARKVAVSGNAPEGSIPLSCFRPGRRFCFPT